LLGVFDMKKLGQLGIVSLLVAGCVGSPGEGDEVADADEQEVGFVAPLGPEPRGVPTRYPILLTHGFNTGEGNYWAFNQIDTAMRADGHLVVLGAVPPFDTPAVRAGFLFEQIDELLIATASEKVNLVCFSMGGLDCRYAVSSMGLAPWVASVTTISTPHRGTGIADAALKVIPGGPIDDRIVNALATVWGLTFNQLAADSHLRAALASQSEANAPAFNAENPDVPGVYYQSWAGVSSVLGLPNPKDNAACRGKMLRHPGTTDALDFRLVAPAAFVAHGLELRPNDGISSVASSIWGDFQGCIPADHLDQVGQVKDRGTDPVTGFNAQRFYRNLAYDLAAKGF
jgi:triacylglycerol lipase